MRFVKQARRASRILLPAAAWIFCNSNGYAAAAAKTEPAPAPALPDMNPPQPRKKRVILVGSGWAAVSFLKNLKPDANTVLTVVSPRGYFLYSPLLPAVATGSIEPRSVMQPMRTLLPAGAEFYEAEATSIDVAGQFVSCKSALDPDNAFRLGYDVLVFAVGSVNNTFGTPGVREHCYFLKSAEDAVTLRTRVHDAFEKAALPMTSPEERARHLTFVICGGGPTGAELAAELHDLIRTDMSRAFPTLARQAKIVIVDSNSHILSMYDRTIAEYATAKFTRDGIQLVLQARVTAVDGTGVKLLHKADGRTERMPAGTVVWATGVGLHPLAASLARGLPPGAQSNTRALTVDDRLRVRGSRGTIYALGDTATVEQDKALTHAASLFAEFDADKSGTLEVHELANLLTSAEKQFPQFREYVRLFKDTSGSKASATGARATTVEGPVKSAISLAFGGSDVSDALKAVFAAADADGSGTLSLDEFKSLLTAMDKHLRAMPATAQVARQQGVYLAGVANGGQLGAVEAIAGPALPLPPAFEWKDMGSMAFIGGDEAVAKLPGVGIVQGLAAGALWRGFETANQQSSASRMAVALDMARTKVFGRDTSTLGLKKQAP